MKIKIQTFKTFINVIFLTVSLTFLFSCGNATKEEDTKEIADENNDNKFDDTKDIGADFIVNAAEMNLEEIKLGQLAQANGIGSDIKELGRTMETEHAKAKKDIEELAAKKQITVPTSITEKGDDAYKKLINKKGIEFDKEYVGMMVKGHKDAIEIFEKASTDVKDPDINSWATSMLPALRSHLDQAMTCEQKTKKM